MLVYWIFNLLVQQTELKWIKIPVYQQDSADHQSALSRMDQSHTSANKDCNTFFVLDVLQLAACHGVSQSAQTFT